MKKILFKAHSPFTIFTCAIIGELYYKEDYKILIMGNPVDEEFEIRIKKSGFFQEICLFDQRVKTVECIEHTVDSFLREHANINEYFMCVFSDGYSIMLAHKLYGNTKLHIFPEGCAALQLKDRISLVFNEVYGKDKLLRNYFRKYKIDLEMFSDTWVFDLTVDQGDINAKKRLIEIRKLLCSNKKDTLINRLNILYGYIPGVCYNTFVLDDALVEANRLDGEAEKIILDNLFESLKGEKILIKPHPGQDLALSKLRFQKYDVDFYENPNIPWEIMLINLINEGRDYITIIVPLLATSVMSTISFFSGYISIKIISLHLLEEKFFCDYIKKAIQLNGNYYENATLNNKNIQVCIPKNFSELKICCGSVKKENIEIKKYAEPYNPSEYFFRVGNMLSKATVFSPDGQFYVDSYFYFLQYHSKIVFDIEKSIDIHEFVWRPSECNIFSAVNGLVVEIENECGIKKKYILGDAQINRFFEDGKIICKVRYSGYCKCLRIKGHLIDENKYCPLNWLYYDCKWRERFWENWYVIGRKKLIKKFVKNKNINNVWIFGYGKIGQAIKDGLESNGIETKFTASKTGEYKGNKISAVEEMYRKEELPDLMIITPMTDYDMIYFNLQNDLKIVTVGLDELMSEMMSG